MEEQFGNTGENNQPKILYPLKIFFINKDKTRLISDLLN